MDFHTLLTLFALLFGLVIGSFLNVCIYRIPAGVSILHPPSHCPRCGQRIRYYDNIPLLGYLFLAGKCRFCRGSISIRYPVVELLSGLISLALFLRYGPSFSYAASFVFMAALLVISFIDLEHQIIPDVISLPGALLGLLLAFFKWTPINDGNVSVRWLDSLAGLLGGAAFFYLVAIVFRWLRKKEGMGMGDVKLLAMIGAWMGWRPLPYIVFIASLSGAFIGGGALLLKHKQLGEKIPFGPFLVIGALLYFFFEKQLLNLWLRIF